MMIRRAFVLNALVVSVLTCQLQGAELKRGVEIGAQAPSWSALPSTDGKEYGLDSFSDAKAVAVVFTCNNCPVAVAYQDRLIELAGQFKDRAVELVAINVNENEGLEAMQQRAQEKGFTFPYLRDDSQQSAREYGATSTPHVFLLDQDRNVVYMGAIDDNWQDGSAATQHYLRDAIEATLAGQQPELAQTKAVGCGIKWSR